MYPNVGWKSTGNREKELKLFTNQEVLNVNQQGENPRQLYKKDGSMVWISSVPDSEDIYVAFFNISDQEQAVAVDFAALNLKGTVAVRDLWQHTELGVLKKQFKQKINAPGAALLGMSPK